MKRLHRLASFRTWATIGTIVVLIVGGWLIFAAYHGWSVGTGDRDKGVTVTLAVTIAAAVLGAVAAVLALVAYLAASGTPDLWVKITFPFCDPNEPVFKVGPPGKRGGWLPLIEPMKQGLAEVQLHNRSAYSAHNPAVRIQLHGISVDARYRPNGAEIRPAADAVIDGWTALKPMNMIGPTVFQWDGGVDQMVHGNWPRDLPAFDLRGAHVMAGASVVMLYVTVVADGVKPVHQLIKVKSLNAREWHEWATGRSMPVGSGAAFLRELATWPQGAQPPESESVNELPPGTEQHHKLVRSASAGRRLGSSRTPRASHLPWLYSALR